jgi:prepilin-type N-terminal cleavage/methylation domain-containing protein
MKAFEKLGFKRGKGKRGFTLIELLIVMVILAILAGVVVMAVGGIFGQAKSRAYDTIKPQIQNGVTAYSTDHNGALPDDIGADHYTINTTGGQSVTNCVVFNMCQITGTGKLLRQVPDGCYQYLTDGSAVTGDTNFGGGACVATGRGQHYIWVYDTSGNVYSICDENLDGYANGSTDMNDGFHGVSTNYSRDIWP